MTLKRGICPKCGNKMYFYSKTCRNCCSTKGINLNEKNNQWKGNKVGYSALHGWIKRRLKKPLKCPKCDIIKKLELVCITHNYTRNLANWIYLCRSCHSAEDKKINNIEMHRKSKHCPTCNVLMMSTRRFCPICARTRRLLWWKNYNMKEARREHHNDFRKSRKM